MKNVKKLIALLLMLTMVLSMAVVASAAAPTDVTKNKIQIENSKTGHTYKIYQLLTGDVQENAEQEGEFHLTSPAWGASIEDTAKTADGLGIEATAWAQYLDTMPTTDLNSYIEDVLIGKGYLKSEVFETMSSETITQPESPEMDPGYYLIVDSSEVTLTKGDSYVNYIVRVLPSYEVLDDVIKVDLATTASNKVGYPTLEKKVKENTNISADSYAIGSKEYTNYNDVADYSIGDTVPFLLKATLPSNYSDYKTYYLQFEDTLPDGLDVSLSSVKVYLLEGETESPITTGITAALDNHKLTVTFGELKDIPTVTDDSILVVKYEAVLNDKANVGQNGNVNTAKLNYSNDPKYTGNGGPDDDVMPKGHTPEDETIVFTYELDVVKQNSEINIHDEHTRLPGAKFELTKIGTTDKKISFLEVKASSDDDAEVVKYVVCDADTAGAVTEVVTNSNGELKLVGLDQGSYSLEETEAPTGYVKLTAPITFIVTAVTKHTQSWDGTSTSALTSLKVDPVGPAHAAVPEATPDVSSGVVTLTINNTSTSQLPTTGGVGTTLFYVFGAAMVICSGVLLLTKKRMSR